MTVIIDDAMRKMVESMVPRGRTGPPEDMAGAAIYLASRAGDYTIGETVTVDGGIVNAHLPTHFADPAAGR